MCVSTSRKLINLFIWDFNSFTFTISAECPKYKVCSIRSLVRPRGCTIRKSNVRMLSPARIEPADFVQVIYRAIISILLAFARPEDKVIAWCINKIYLQFVAYGKYITLCLWFVSGLFHCLQLEHIDNTKWTYQNINISHETGNPHHWLTFFSSWKKEM